MIKNNYISLRNNNNNSTFTCNSKKLRENNNSPHQHYPNNNNNNHSKYDIHVIIEEEEQEQSYLKEGNINNNNYKKNQLRQNQKPKDLQNNPFQILSEIERNTYIKELSQFYEEKVKLLKEENIQLNKELENSNQTLQFLSEENSILRSSLLTLQDEKKKIKLILKRKEKELEKYLEKGFNLSINKTGSEIISTINNNTIHNNNKTTNLNSSKHVCKEIKSGSSNSNCGSDKKRRDRGMINSFTGAVTDTDTCKEEEEEVDKEKKELRKTIEQLKILLLEEEKKQQALHASKQTLLNSNNNMNHNNKNNSNINMMNNNSSNNNTKNNMTDPIFTEYFLKYKDFKNHSNLNNNSTCLSDGKNFNNKNVNSFVMDVDRVQELEDKFEQLLLVKKELENKLLKREEQLFEMTNKYEGLRKTINKR
ncbi:hypothetical protein ABK040_007946 [Willaertia magna]